MRDLNTNVLVIDWDESACKLLREILEAEGYGTTWCTSLANAEPAMVYTRPAVVLFGVSSFSEPELSVIAMIRRHDPSASIVLMSTSLDIRDWAERAGAVAYFNKPFDVTTPPEVVARALAARRGNRPNRRRERPNPSSSGGPSGTGGPIQFRRHSQIA